MLAVQERRVLETVSQLKVLVVLGSLALVGYFLLAKLFLQEAVLLQMPKLQLEVIQVTFKNIFLVGLNLSWNNIQCNLSIFSALYTSKPTLQSNVPCLPGSTECPKSEEGNQLISNSNGVISGPGTGSIPVDESSSGSYLGLKIPGDTGISHNF